MTITTLATSLKNQGDQMSPAVVADFLRLVKFGTVLRQNKVALRGLNMASQPSNPYNLATLQVVTLPDDCKALTIYRAYGRTASGTGTPGELSVQAAYTTPSANQIAVTPSGDIGLLAAAGWTNLDIVFEPDVGDTIELTLPVVTNALTLPNPLNGLANGVAITLIEAEALAGTVVGKKIVLAPGSAPATLQAALNAAKATVAFQATDAVTSARVKLLVQSAVDTNVLLEAASPLL